MRAPLATGLLVFSVAASACSGGEAAPSPSTLPPVTQAPTPTPDPVPSEATAATPEGAAEFVRFFYAQLERAYAEANPDLIAAISAEGCESCRNFVESLTQLRDGNGRVEDFVIEVVDVQAAAVEPAAATVSAVVVINASEYVRKEADGTESAREAPVSGAINDVTLTRASGSWLMQEISQ